MNYVWRLPQNVRGDDEIITYRRPVNSHSSGSYSRSDLDYVDYFYAAHKRWISETKFTSSPRDLTSNRNFQVMVSLARIMLPYIIEDLKSKPSSIVMVLDAAFSEKPYSSDDAGSIPLMSNAWIAWAERNGPPL